MAATNDFKFAAFGLAIVHAAWMKNQAMISRLSENDEEIFAAARATDVALSTLEKLLRARSLPTVGTGE